MHAERGTAMRALIVGVSLLVISSTQQLACRSVPTIQSVEASTMESLPQTDSLEAAVSSWHGSLE
jgi:hypothetical protein